MMTSTVRNTRDAQHTATAISSPDQLSSAGHEVELGAARDRSCLNLRRMSGPQTATDVDCGGCHQGGLATSITGMKAL